MANGRAHDRFNFFTGALFIGVMIGLGLDFYGVSGLSLGVLVSTLYLSPDLDIMPKKRAGIFRFILYPYSLLFKHRGKSHKFIIGTLSRILYLGSIVFIIIWLLNRTGDIDLSSESALHIVINFLLNTDYEQPHYRFLIWSLLGMLFADGSHLFLDSLTSFTTRVKRIFKTYF